jgi:hypothetical protein
VEQEPRKPRQPFTWPDVIVMGICAYTILGALALIIWAFK